MPILSSILHPRITSLLTLAGTQDTTATFGELEELKTILRAGAGQFDIQTVCEVHTRRTPFPVFPVFTASIGSPDPLAPVVGFLAAFMDWNELVRRSYCTTCGCCFFDWNGTSCYISNLKKCVLFLCLR